MNGYERVLAHLAGQPVDSLPLMPITMMFAADQAGVKYGDYARDHRVLVKAQLHTAEQFDFDYVSCISDPAREAADWALGRILVPVSLGSVGGSPGPGGAAAPMGGGAAAATGNGGMGTGSAPATNVAPSGAMGGADGRVVQVPLAQLASIRLVSQP